MSNLKSELITRIHRSDHLFSLAITGGGTSAISALFAEPGASRTVLEATVPYDNNALSRFVSAKQAQACSNSTARAMAMAAYQSAVSLAPDANVMGLGCTAAIATDRTRKGADRCHVALQSAEFTRTYDLELDKQLDRAAQEQLTAELIIDVIAEASGLASEFSLGLIKPSLNRTEHVASTEWQALLAGDSLSCSDESYTCLFPGAFNPIHAGHRGMLQVAGEMLGTTAALEVSIRNVDKPPLDFLSMAERANSDYPMVFTNAATFVEKSAIFPGATFIVGIDTITRIDETRYYADATAKANAIKTMSDRDTKFLVFGREVPDTTKGKRSGFTTLGDVTLSPELRSLCTEVPEERFRKDVSSSEIRNNQA